MMRELDITHAKRKKELLSPVSGCKLLDDLGTPPHLSTNEAGLRGDICLLLCWLLTFNPRHENNGYSVPELRLRARKADLNEDEAADNEELYPDNGRRS